MVDSMHVPSQVQGGAALQAQLLELTWSSDLQGFQEPRQAVAGFLEQRLYSQSLAQDLILVIDEAVSNAARHSYQGQPGYQVRSAIELTELEAGGLSRIRVLIRDYGALGRRFDPIERFAIARQEAGKSAGFGMVLMHRLMDVVAYETTEAENRLELVRWFCNGPAKLEYVQALVQELQQAGVLPGVNRATLEELFYLHSALEPGDLLLVLGAIKRVDQFDMRKAIADARLRLAGVS